ncbi:MAG: hypothetical protein Q9186_000888 [Xanthomendoza sp. 1 TL-2023]
MALTAARPRPRQIHIHFYSFGKSLGYPDFSPPHPLSHRPLQTKTPPPPEICDYYTGLDPEVADHFWSFPEHERRYRRAYRRIHRLLREIRPGEPRRWAVLVNCRAGVHRSVAFVSRLREEIAETMPVMTDLTHLGFGRALDERMRRWGGLER